jgi:DNA-binding CsgD family transcriptional regulator
MGRLDTNKYAADYNNSAAQKLINFCKPLRDYFGVQLFVYFKVFSDGSYVILSNDVNYAKNYCAKIHAEHACIHKWTKVVGQKNIALWSRDPSKESMQLTLDIGYWNCMSMFEQTDDYIESAIFGADKDNEQINEFYIRHNRVLEHFFECFKIQFASEIETSSLNRARYRDGLNFVMSDYETQAPPDIEGFKRALEISNIIRDGKFIKLSKREMQCLELISEGYSTKGIGSKLMLSPRTVEIFNRNLKKKLGYSSKHELIRIYRESFDIS